jgi:hypothetical protein
MKTEQLRVDARIGDVEAAAEHGHCPAAGVERTRVRGGVDPRRSPTHHATTRVRESGAKRPGRRQAQRRGAPATDHRDRDLR